LDGDRRSILGFLCLLSIICPTSFLGGATLGEAGRWFSPSSTAPSLIRLGVELPPAERRKTQSRARKEAREVLGLEKQAAWEMAAAVAGSEDGEAAWYCRATRRAARFFIWLRRGQAPRTSSDSHLRKAQTPPDWCVKLLGEVRTENP